MSNKNVTQRAELIAGQGPNPSTYGFAELEYMFVNGAACFITPPFPRFRF